jgi:thiamine pyrophosphokinase
MNQKFNNALIFLNGDEENLSYTKAYLKDRTLLIGCDGGTDKIYNLGLKPNAVIGDFDSIESLPSKIKTLPKNDYGKKILIDGITYIKYPGDKDFLDSEAAIDFAADNKLTEITLVNAHGDELDHVLGIMIILANRKYRHLNIRIITPNQKIFIAQGKTVFNGMKGNRISLIPLYGQVIVKSSSGLKYDPSKYRMSLEHNIGISNEFTSKKAAVHISSGCFLVIQYY